MAALPRASFPNTRNATLIKARDAQQQPGPVTDYEPRRPGEDDALSSNLELPRSGAKPTRSELPSSNFSLIKQALQYSLLHRSKQSVSRKSKAAGLQKVPKMIAQHLESRKQEGSAAAGQQFEATTEAALRKAKPAAG